MDGGDPSRNAIRAIAPAFGQFVRARVSVQSSEFPAEVEVVEQEASGGQDRHSIIVAYKYSVRFSLLYCRLSSHVTAT